MFAKNIITKLSGVGEANGLVPPVSSGKKSLRFNGSTQYIQGADAWTTGDAEHSIVAWIKLEGNPPWITIFDGREGGNDGLRFYLYYQKLVHKVNAGTSSSTALVPTHEWIFVAGRRGDFTDEEGINACFINGQKQTHVDNVDRGNLDITSGDYRIGANISASSKFVGLMSDIVLYDKGLSDAEMLTIYNQGNPYDYLNGVQSASVKHWWKFGDGEENGTGTTIYDAANGFDGATQNMDDSNYSEDNYGASSALGGGPRGGAVTDAQQSEESE
jgi:hypothetical protein